MPRVSCFSQCVDGSQMWLFTAKAESKSPHLLSLLSGVQSGVECVNNTERQIGRQIVTGFGLSASVVESGVPSISSGSNAAGCAFERCLVSLPFSRAGALRSSAARCTLIAPRSQRSRWTAGGGLPARAVDGRRICLVAACAGQRVNCNACGRHSTRSSSRCAWSCS